MSSYKYDSIVSKSEVEALKDMIFKRAQERAEALNTETQASYTSAVQKEVMDIARDSFNSNKNPFSINNNAAKAIAEPHPQPTKPAERFSDEEIGFSKRQVDYIKTQIQQKNKASETEIGNKEKLENMEEARNGFQNKKTFMGALNFLNSQASISLIKNKGKHFEALA